MYVYVSFNINLIGVTLELKSPTEDTINPLYHTVTIRHSKISVEKTDHHYDEVNVPSEVKITSSPAYTVS